jgi:hypothetical protein
LKGSGIQDDSEQQSKVAKQAARNTVSFAKRWAKLDCRCCQDSWVGMENILAALSNSNHQASP